MPTLEGVVPVELTRMEIGDYGDLLMIADDLDFAIRALETVIPKMPEGEGPFDVDDQVADEVTAFWNAAVVAYARCFVKGPRIRLRAEQYLADDPEALTHHQFYYRLRDKYIAHAVFDAERVKVFVGLRPAGEEPRLSGIGDTFLSRGLEIRGRGRDLLYLAQRARSDVESRLMATRDAMLTAAAGVPIEDLEGRPRVENMGTLPTELRPRRRRPDR